jgi:hypothetical protein
MTSSTSIFDTLQADLLTSKPVTAVMKDDDGGDEGDGCDVSSLAGIVN